VLQSTRDEERIAQVLEIVERSEGAGIVYTATVRAAESLRVALLEAGVKVGLYHGRMRAAERHAQQEAFMSGDARVIVATNAFGLGIDKPDIRFVVHFQLPPGLDAYYQEAGRAGRDGESACCTLIYQHSDQRLRQFLQAGRYPTTRDVVQCIDVLAALPPESDGLTLRQLLDVAAVAETKVRVIVELLKDNGMVRQTRERRLVPVAQRLDRSAAAQLSSTYRERAHRDKRELERIAFYARTGFCRWKVLLEHFGDTQELERCGRCDNCLHPPARRILNSRTGRVPSARMPRPAYACGQYARVRRYGVGRVIASSSQSVTLEFPDGSRRDFLPSFLRPAPSAGR